MLRSLSSAPVAPREPPLWINNRGSITPQKDRPQLRPAGSALPFLRSTVNLRMRVPLSPTRLAPLERSHFRIVVRIIDLRRTRTTVDPSSSAREGDPFDRSRDARAPANPSRRIRVVLRVSGITYLSSLSYISERAQETPGPFKPRNLAMSRNQPCALGRPISSLYSWKHRTSRFLLIPAQNALKSGRPGNAAGRT